MTLNSNGDGTFTQTRLAVHEVRLEIFDATGRSVRPRADQWFPAGTQAVVWDGVDHAGHPTASGTYLYRIRVRDGSRSGRLTLIR
jgi:hypothetical protein